MSRFFIILGLCVLTLTGCRHAEQEYVSPKYDEIRREFAPTENLPAPLPTDETIPENTVVTPMIPFE